MKAGPFFLGAPNDSAHENEMAHRNGSFNV